MRVPRVQSQGPAGPALQAQSPEPYPAIGSDQGKSIAKGMGVLSQGLSRLGEAISEENDEARTQGAFNLYEESVRGVLNPKTGYLSQVGESAVDGYEDAVEEMEAKRRTFAESLQNPRQRELYESATRAFKVRGMARIDAHAAKQTRVFNIGTKSALLEGLGREYDEMVLSGGATDEELEHALLRMRQAASDITVLTTGASEDSDIVKNTLAVLDGAHHAGVVSKLIEAKTLTTTENESGEVVEIFAAESYLEKHGDKIPAQTRVGIEEQLDTIKRVKKSQVMAKSIFASAPEGSSPAQLQAHVLDTVDWTIKGKKLSPEEADALRAEANKLINNNNDLSAAISNAVMEKAEKQLQEMIQRGLAPTVQDLSVYSQLTRGQRATLQKRLDTANKVETSPHIWQAWMRLAEGQKVIFYEGEEEETVVEGLVGMTPEVWTKLSRDLSPQDQRKFYADVVAANPGKFQSSPSQKMEELRDKHNKRLLTALGTAGDSDNDLLRAQTILTTILPDLLAMRGITPTSSGEDYAKAIDEIIADAPWVDQWGGDERILIRELDTDAAAVQLGYGQVGEPGLGNLRAATYWDEVFDGEDVFLDEDGSPTIPLVVQEGIARQLKAQKKAPSGRNIVHTWLSLGKPMTIAEAKVAPTEQEIISQGSVRSDDGAGVGPEPTRSFGVGGRLYDMQSAVEAGMRPDADGHWGSRVDEGENEGLILKHITHPTFWKTIKGEDEAGMVWWHDPNDGRWYTFPEGEEDKPRSKGLLPEHPEDSIEYPTQDTGGQVWDEEKGEWTKYGTGKPGWINVNGRWVKLRTPSKRTGK